MSRRAEACGKRHMLLCVELGTAVYCHAVVIVDLPFKHPLGLAKAVIGGIASGKGHDRQRDQGKRKDYFSHALYCQLGEIAARFREILRARKTPPERGLLLFVLEFCQYIFNFKPYCHKSEGLTFLAAQSARYEFINV